MEETSHYAGAKPPFSSFSFFFSSRLPSRKLTIDGHIILPEDIFGTISFLPRDIFKIWQRGKDYNFL